MDDAARLIRDCRRQAGLTQTELAKRLGTTQSAIAKLERPGSNPTVQTLDRVLRPTGHRLQLIAPYWSENGVDVGLLRKNLRKTPAERLESFVAFQRSARKLYDAGARARGELA